MSLDKLSQHLAQHGRGNDSMLVHMSPKEVGALQSMAQQHGGSLTINPHTGLPEAGFLDAILPTVIGAGAAIASGGTLSPLLVAGIAGAGTGLITHDLGKGLMAGLGAFGGASLAGGLMEAGVGAATDAAVSAGASANPVGAEQVLTGTDASVARQAAQGVNAINPEMSMVKGATPELSGWDKLQKGFEATKFDTNYLKNNMFGIGAAAAPLLAGAANGSLFGSTSSTPNTQQAGYIRPYDYTQTRNPAYTGAGTPYFNQSMTPQTPVLASDWGSRTMANGGLAALANGGNTQEGIAALGGQNNMFPMSQMDHTQYATPTQQPTSAEVVDAGYEEKTDPYMGTEVRMADGGTPQLAMSNRYSAPARIMSQDVIDHQNMLATRALQEYNQPLLAAMTPQQLRPATLGTVPAANSGISTYRTPNLTPVAGLPGGTSDQYKALQDQIATLKAQQAQQANYDNSGSGGGGGDGGGGSGGGDADGGLMAYKHPNMYAAGGSTSNMAAIDNYAALAAQGQDGMQQVLAKAKAGDYNAQIALNKLQNTPNQNYAAGGGIYNLGGYSDGGRLLKGPGDGVSDDIPATIGQKQPARLADGEFVVPARIVSELGNGSTDAGAKRLYQMMERVQQGRKKSVGKDKVAVDSKSYKHLPA